MQPNNSKIRSCKFANEAFLPEVIRLLACNHTCTINLRGYSMRPFLEDNRDKALLAKPDEVKIGDVVLAEISNGVYVLHRIVGIDTRQDIITLRGDGNINNETCRMENVKAIAKGFYRKGRDKLDSTDGRKWKTYSYIWTRLYPIRRYLLYLYRCWFV